ncbi:hypothetical protein PybrP1_001605 [[Pythium] brassicae (nom. inval.)]|nr:hypothetical protein PybrP1_001605 [[Pythium] brassicae (nom. inval.)]
MCNELAELFCSFVKSLEREQDGSRGLGTSDTEVDDVGDQELGELKRVCTILNHDASRAVKRGATWAEKWFGEYACALVAEVVSGSSLALKLVCLDEWKHIKVSELDEFMTGLTADIELFIATLITVQMEKRQQQSWERVPRRGGTADKVVLQFKLHLAHTTAVALIQRGLDAQVFERRFVEIRNELLKLVDDDAERTAALHHLPNTECLGQIGASLHDLEFCQPECPDVFEGTAGAACSEAFVRSQLGFLDLISPQTCSAEELIAWAANLKAVTSSKDTVMFGLRTIETFMMTSTRLLEQDNDAIGITSADVRTILDDYEYFVDEWSAGDWSGALFDVEQHSRELLKWISLCVVRKNAEQSCPLAKEFGVSLDWRQLRVAVLKEALSIQALETVAWFIRSKIVEGNKVLFHLSHTGPTSSFAREAAAGSALYVRRYDMWIAEFKRKVAGYWREVTKKKEEAASLRAKIVEIEGELSQAKADLGTLTLGMSSRERDGAKDATAVRAAKLRGGIRELEQVIDNMRTKLSKTLRAPSGITSPLPKDRERALETLFLMDMPHEIALLAEISFIAQRALAGSAADATALQETRLGIPWSKHFNEFSSSNHVSKAGIVVPYPQSMEILRPHESISVDDLLDEEDCARMCVWYPSGEHTKLLWQVDEVHKTSVNPFLIIEDMVLSRFTHALPPQFSSFQWAIAHPGGAERGNLVYSKVLEPYLDGFDKRAFLTFGLLRAFPCQQVRKVCCAVKDNLLPWSHPCVAAVVRQAMFQIGELTDTERPVLKWKTDMRSREGLALLCAAVDCAATRLNASPRNYEDVRILSELAAFMLQLTSDARPIVNKFVDMCVRWARDARTQLLAKRAVSSEETVELRAHECPLYGYALQSYTLGECDDVALCRMGELMVLFRNGLSFSSESSRWAELQKLEVAVCETMTRRVEALVGYFVGDEGCHASNTRLTKLLRLVNNSASSTLSWRVLAPEVGAHWSSCVEALDTANDTLYSMNLCTGVILTDGNLPGGLPVQIRSSAQYRELFGGQDFEVVTNKAGVSKTAHPIQGCFFHFVPGDTEFYLREVYLDDESRVQKTVVLCDAASIGRLQESNNLPPRMLAMHSLWYWVEEDCVLARPKSAFGKDAAFIFLFSSLKRNPRCCQVDSADRRLPHDVLLERLTRYDVFVHLDEQLVRVLSKFDDAANIYALRTPSGQLKISLPRYRLSFVQDASARLRSVEYNGYALAQDQQFHDVFLLFSQYLVLSLFDQQAVAKPRVCVVVPIGTVDQLVKDESIRIKVCDAADASLSFVAFDEHRRFQSLVAESTTSRLQLCALLASTGSTVPSRYLKMTGGQAALNVLQGCHSSQPLSAFEVELLRNICKFGHLEPALRVLASSIHKNALACGFLSGAADAAAEQVRCENALTAYAKMCAHLPARNVLRCCLPKAEEKLIGGHILHGVDMSRYGSFSAESSASSPVKADFVARIEAKLSSLLVNDIASKARSVAPPLPVKQLTVSKMGSEMNRELEESWDAYHSLPDVCLAKPLAELEPEFQRLLLEVKAAREQVLEYVLEMVDRSRNDIASRILKLVDYLPTPTIADVVQSVCDDDVLTVLLSTKSASHKLAFRASALQFMELCVLEDKLERLVAAAQQNAATASIVDELSSVRAWDSRKYPFWLAFEVEGRLQIRHEQFEVARFLIESRGSVCQLNMGRGKTRVILPMLFLYFSHRRQDDRLVRAHFLTPLLSETRHFMHQNLAASATLRLNFAELPFHRNVALDDERAAVMRDVVSEANECGKFLVVAPEHRMSLELKRLELQAAAREGDRAMIETLGEVLDAKQYVDLMDECDAVLSHKYHLVYAVGTPQRLESGESRWTAIEALLAVLSRRSSAAMRALLARPGVSSECLEYTERRGGFSGLRLNASVENKAQVRGDLKLQLARDLIESPPESFKWLPTVADKVGRSREVLVRALTDRTVNLDEVLGDSARIVARSYLDQLLALRGLLAFDVLEHCLEKRHRVDYGLPNLGARKKRIAIPFRAADFPSERSEFSHPDISIAFTVLAYYHMGLSEPELKEALGRLLLLGLSDQEAEYELWIQSIGAPGGLEDELPREAHQISPSSTRQFALLYKTYRYSVKVINFFVNLSVFPSDTTQYPSRLARSSWDLAGGDWNIGFSGTNDNHRLLPLSVVQGAPRLPSLSGTNGRMVDRIIQENKGYEVIERSAVAPWKALLGKVVDKHAHALIDTGALLAGVLNNEAAVYLLGLIGFAFAGVTYYDTRSVFDCWVVLDATSKQVTPLKQSAMLERDTFVIFDDARSRGSDMKLLPGAVAVLTLGPKLTKDKLMQGAGRMRQLGCSQKLWFVSQEDVALNITQTCRKESVATVDAADVLVWVMDNTKTEATHGLLEWSSSGFHIAKARQDANAELVDEDWSLASLYRHAFTPELISNIVRSNLHALFKAPVAELDELVGKICDQAVTYGCDEEVLVASHNEECERELHAELLQAGSVRDVGKFVTMPELSAFVHERVLPAGFGSANWGSGRVFGTPNFFKTVDAQSSDPLPDFMRLVDFVIHFADGTMLLLSEYEADLAKPKLFGPPSRIQSLELVSVARLQLYNNDTKFTKQQVKLFSSAIRELLKNMSEREPTIRGAVHELPPVPPVLNRIFDKITHGVAAASGAKKLLFDQVYAAKKYGLKNDGYLTHALWDPVVFNNLKSIIGNMHIIMNSSAPLSH